MENSTPAARGQAAAGILIDSQNVDAMVMALKDNYMLLKIPRDTLGLVLPQLDFNPSEVLAKEIEFHISFDPTSSPDTPGRYNESHCGIFDKSDGMSNFMSDLTLLGTLKGGTTRALALCARGCEQVQDEEAHRDCGELRDMEKHKRTATSFDALFLQLLRNCPREEVDARIQVFWSDLRVPRREGNSIVGQFTWRQRGEGYCRYFARNPFFRCSCDYLRELHSEKVGHMLAMKVAGHHLPAELVELIGDACFNKNHMDAAMAWALEVAKLGTDHPSMSSFELVEQDEDGNLGFA